jgi:hypothetical protein
MPLPPALRGQSIRAKADVRLVGDQGDIVEMHSILLMTLSPYFQIVLGDKEPGCTIQLLGADDETLRLIKEYAYDGKITGLNNENIDKVHRVADMYNIIGILNECQVFYKKHQHSSVQTTKSS